ncbi:MAG: hypothetical protein J5726_01360 [Treponema sp.]|nr:hypothetical protein [Treponema sp.]
MKRIIVSVLTALTLVGLLASCGSTLKLKGEDPVMMTGTPEIIDYQGLALGSQIPDWVIAIGDGSQKKVRRSLDIPNSKQIFILQNKGTDLDYVQIWTDQVDARAEIASSIEQTIAQTVQSEISVQDAGMQVDEKSAKIYSATMTNVTVNGLVKECYYWIKTRTPQIDSKNPKVVKDYKEEYTYYVVYTIDKDLYERQLKQAMDDVQDNDDQTQFLKEVLSDKLMSSIIVSSTGIDPADNYVYTIDDDYWYDYYDAK